MKLHTVASDGPWVPDAYVPPQDPTPVQTPKPYVLVMLKGFCTEFFDTPQALEAFATRMYIRNQHFECYKYWPTLGYYTRVSVSPPPQ